MHRSCVCRHSLASSGGKSAAVLVNVVQKTGDERRRPRTCSKTKREVVRLNSFRQNLRGNKSTTATRWPNAGMRPDSAVEALEERIRKHCGPKCEGVCGLHVALWRTKAVARAETLGHTIRSKPPTHIAVRIGGREDTLAEGARVICRAESPA